ncbi:hypothetical protein KSS87_001152 [Heliosperma pusillum]|nr:hypothetical protein KSS87_001152 [Heliosperma pusillum]
MGGLKEKAPVIAMLFLQCVYAAMTLLNRAALVQGMNPRVFIFYRQAIGTLVISPFAYLMRVSLNQTVYFEGLFLAPSSIASAMANLIPAITFLIAATMGGPLFSAMFNPLCTVITTVFACVFLHEQLYIGSLLGGVTVIIGLYVVLWGKGKEMKPTLVASEIEDSSIKTVDQEKICCPIDLEQPLLSDSSIVLHTNED